MHTITTFSLLCQPPRDAQFCTSSYSAFREQLDRRGQESVRLYALQGAVLVCDRRHRVLGRITVPAVDHWGIASDTEYQLPGSELRLSLLQRAVLRAGGALTPVCRWWLRSLDRIKPSLSRRSKTAGTCGHGAIRCSEDGATHVKWTTMRLAG